MDILMIAVLKSGNQKGYRLIDVDNPQDIKEYPEKIVHMAISTGKVQVRNLGVNGNEVIGTNGVLDRYAVVDSVKGVVGNSPLVIISQLEDVGYKVVDCKGTIKAWETAKVVEYAKKNGIANGKIVSKNNMEFISSIVGTYNVEMIKGKTKATGEVKRVSAGNTTMAKYGEVEAENLIDEKDALEVLNEDQRTAIRNYYVWYTVEQYRGLAKDIRLNLAPGKVEALSQLKGEEDWEFAGIVDLGYVGGGKCTLGHDLRYAYFAAPSRTRDDRSTWIIFGSSCAGDFFDISKEEMANLNKARQNMIDEIKEITEVIANDTLDEMIKRTELLNDVVDFAIENKKLTKLFGNRLGVYARDYRKSGLPIPRSLVIQIGDRFREDSNILNEFISGLDVMKKRIGDRGRYTSGYANRNILRFMEFVRQHAIEGEYMYNPNREKEFGRARKDMGKYDKTARYARSRMDAEFKAYGVKYGTLDEVRDSISLYEMLQEYGEKIQEGLNHIGNNRIMNSYSVASELQRKAAQDTDTKTAAARNLLANCLVTLGSEYASEIRDFGSNKVVVDEPNGYRKNLKPAKEILERYREAKDIADKELSEFLAKAAKDKKDLDDKTAQQEKEMRIVRERLEREKLARAEREKAEDERLAKLRAEEYEAKKAKEAKEKEAQKEAKKDDKVNQLKALYEKYPDVDSGRGRIVAEAIIRSEKLFNELTQKQAWRIDNEINYMLDKTNDTEIIAEPVEIENKKHELEDNSDLSLKMKVMVGVKETENFKEVEKKFQSILSIIESVRSRKTYTDKQKRYIEKAFELLAEMSE